MIQISIKIVDSGFCSLCNKSFYKKRDDLFDPNSGWVNFCSMYCFERWLKIRELPQEVVSEREFLWWTKWAKSMKLKEQQKFALTHPNLLAHWLNSENTGSKTAQLLAQKAGSSLPLQEGEPLSHEPENNLNLEPTFSGLLKKEERQNV